MESHLKQISKYISVYLLTNLTWLSSFSNDMFFSNDLLSCCQSIGAFILRTSLHLVGDGSVAFLLLAVLIEEDNDKDHHRDPDQYANHDEACLSFRVVLVGWDKLLYSHVRC